MTRRWVLLVTVVLLMACTSPGERPTSTDTLGSPAVSPSPKAPGVFVRACDDSVFGELGQGWKKASVIMGPIAFVGLPGYRDGPDRYFRSRHGQYPALKVLAVVNGNGVISVSIARRDTDRVRMMYDPPLGATAICTPSRQATRPRCLGPVCPIGRPSSMAFLVTGRTCATLEVSAGGRQPIRKLVSFGAPSCPD